MVRKLLLTALAIVALLAAPAAAQYPEIVVQPGRVTPGGTVTVTGKGCMPGATVVITLKRVPSGSGASLPAGGSDVQLSRAASSGSTLRVADLDVGEVVATVTADEEGNFTASFKVPAHATPGFYDVISECDGIVRSQRIEVLGTDTTPPGGGNPAPDGALPRTGSNLNGIGLLGAGLLVIGGLVLLTSRKRRTAEA